MFKNFMRIFSPKYFAILSRDCRATVVRRSCECREPVAAKFWRIFNAKFSRHSYEFRASVVRRSRDSIEKTCKHLATIWRENKTKASISLACEFLATVLRLSFDVRASVANLSRRNFGEFSMQNFRDTRTNVVRVSYDGRATVLRKHANTSRLSGEKIKLKLVSHWHVNFSRLFCDCRSTFVRVSRTCRGEILANLQCEIFATLVRMSCECRTTVTRQS